VLTSTYLKCGSLPLVEFYILLFRAHIPACFGLLMLVDTKERVIFHDRF